MDSNWYYVDATGQRQGPVTAEAVADAVRAGVADDRSLVWREGMAEWRPLGGFRTELGLPPTPPIVAPQLPPPRGPLPPPGSPPGTPAKKSNKGCLIVALVVSGLVLLVMVVLAALALPAYQDYMLRSKVMIAVAEGRALQSQVDDFVVNTDRCPRDASEVALPEASDRGFVAMTVGEAETGMCTIDIELGGRDADPVAGEHILLSRDAAGDWYCTSDLARRELLPADCR